MTLSYERGLLAASLGKAGVYLGRFCFYQKQGVVTREEEGVGEGK